MYPALLGDRETAAEIAMTYYFAKTLTDGFDDAVRRTTDALKKEGFGIITEIDGCKRKLTSIFATTGSLQSDACARGAENRGQGRDDVAVQRGDSRNWRGSKRSGGH